MPEGAESTAGGPHPRGSDSLSNMSSMAGGEPRRGIWRSTWSDDDSMASRSHLHSSDSRTHIDSMAGGAPTRRVDNWSDNESMAGGAPCRVVRGQINVDLSESTGDSDHGWFATDPGAGLREDSPMSLDRQRDRYLIICQKNVAPYVGGPMNLDVDWLKPGMEKYTTVGGGARTLFQRDRGGWPR